MVASAAAQASGFPLKGEPAPGTPKAGLDLVDDEQRATLIAQPTHALQVLGAARSDASLALHDLEQNGCRTVRHSSVHPFQVVVRHVGEAGHERHERFAVPFLPGGRERAHRAAVKAAHSGHDAAAPCGQTSELERALHSLSARVAKKGALQAGYLGETSQQRGTPVAVKDAGAGDHLGGLLADRGRHLGMTVPDDRHTVSADAVNIRPPVIVPHASALPANQDEMAHRIRAGRMCLLQRNGVHSNSPLS
jgi:hypothetical protein